MTEDTIIRDALTLATLPPGTALHIVNGAGYNRHAGCMVEMLLDHDSGYIGTVRTLFVKHGARVIEPPSSGRCTWCGALFWEKYDGRK